MASRSAGSLRSNFVQFLYGPAVSTRLPVPPPTAGDIAFEESTEKSQREKDAHSCAEAAVPGLYRLQVAHCSHVHHMHNGGLLRHIRAHIFHVLAQLPGGL